MITNFNSIGDNIRMYRKKRGLTQEGLAEMCELSTNYIGMLERAEKAPSLNTLLNIINALKVSADMLLNGTIDCGYKIKSSLLSEQIGRLPKREQDKIYEVVELMIKQAETP